MVASISSMLCSYQFNKYFTYAAKKCKNVSTTSSGAKFTVLISPFLIQPMQHYSTKILNTKMEIRIGRQRSK
jgi:putative flippase GtrA